jgi:hypothetical protein
MSIVNKIVSIINDNIKANSCINIRTIGLSEVLIREGKTFPVIYENGDIEHIFFDDSFECELYHYATSENNNNNNNKGFGDNKLIEKTFDNSIILYARNTSTEYITEIIDKGLTTLTTQAQRNVLGVNFVDIEIKSIKSDKQSIYKSEFGELRYKLNANDVLVKIEYRIIFDLQNKCLTPSKNNC